MLFVAFEPGEVRGSRRKCIGKANLEGCYEIRKAKFVSCRPSRCRVKRCKHNRDGKTRSSNLAFCSKGPALSKEFNWNCSSTE